MEENEPQIKTQVMDNMEYKHTKKCECKRMCHTTEIYIAMNMF